MERNVFVPEFVLQMASFWIDEAMTACVSLDMDQDNFYGH